MTRGYYVTILRGSRVGWLVGPFDTQEAARELVQPAREAAERIDPFTHFDAFGVTALTAETLRAGALNQQLGVQSHD